MYWLPDYINTTNIVLLTEKRRDSIMERGDERFIVLSDACVFSLDISASNLVVGTA
jgi:hypothetical protein